MRGALGSGTISAMAQIVPDTQASLETLVARSAALRTRAERAESHLVLELLDAADDTLNGPLAKTYRTLTDMTAFLDQIEALLA